MRGLTLIAILFSITLSYGQQFSWKLIKQYGNPTIDAFGIDPIGNLILATNSSLVKLDNQFQIQFTQGNTMYGKIAEIDAKHSLKTLLFSESQQLITFIDNTLSYRGEKVDLKSLGIGYATNVCYSGKTRNFWIYDESNSRLLQFTGLVSAIKQSEITNLFSITRETVLTDMKEHNNQLYLFYENDAIFIVDQFGGLIKRIASPNAIHFVPYENKIYLLTKNNIIVYFENGTKKYIALPQSNFDDFLIFKNYFYFKNDVGIIKYELIKGG